MGDTGGGWVGGQEQQMQRLCSPRPLSSTRSRASFSWLLLRYNMGDDTRTEHADKHPKAVTFLHILGNLFLFLKQFKCLAHIKLVWSQTRIILILNINHTLTMFDVFTVLQRLFLSNGEDDEYSVWVMRGALGPQVYFLSCG